MPEHRLQHSTQATNLADILERVLDKGVVVAGDITISLVGVELLNIKIRLLIASVDKALEMGINWWEADPTLSVRARQLEAENQALRAYQLTDQQQTQRIQQLLTENQQLSERITALERQLTNLKGK